ncbi:uncharacterized protein V5649_002922 isoform 2-T2 [Rhynchonycteris naso]
MELEFRSQPLTFSANNKMEKLRLRKLDSLTLRFYRHSVAETSYSTLLKDSGPAGRLVTAFSDPCGDSFQMLLLVAATAFAFTAKERTQQRALLFCIKSQPFGTMRAPPSSSCFLCLQASESQAASPDAGRHMKTYRP